MSVALTGNFEDEAGELDADLVRRFLDGEEVAFSRLYHRHRPLVEGVCRRYLTSTNVPDAVQETFTRFLKVLPRLSSAERVGGVPRCDRSFGLPGHIAQKLTRRSR